MISKTSSARRVLHLKAKAMKELEELQARLEKLKPEAMKKLARKARIAEIGREIVEATSSLGTSFRSISPLDSLTEDLGWMDKSQTAGNEAKSNIAVSVHSTPENVVKLVHEGKFSAPMRDSKPLEIPTISADAAGQDDRNYRFKAYNGPCRQGATSQPKVKVANKKTSKLLTTEFIQNWSETIVVGNCR